MLRITDSQVTFHGQTVRLTTQEKKLLTILLDSRGEVISREMIFDSLYGDFDEIPEPKILDVLICKIRKKLSTINIHHHIETFPGTGYGFDVNADHNMGDSTVSKTFHHQMMRKLDGATYEGRTIPARVHYAMREALRKAQMRGAAIMTDRELAKATFEELVK